MHLTRVKLKDGTTFEAVIREWCPDEGYVVFMGTGRLIRFIDVETMTTESVRASVAEDRDELVRARDDGWDGT